ncbi:pao retrotransposon peptidase domain-containing protein [Ditylenchus destructor]|uniref:Pao retrotransposon peptidase domain-containing protein n=1 Tax=Ditylenchus destructor TaxID=166010 RepID=A0AAD4MUX2_9BILA|nr:pao retrotransposon peptidase domain-containing protein [Ditylenchus destructor]
MSEQIKAGLVPHTTALTAKLDSLPEFQVPSLAADQPIEDYREQLDDLDIQLSESVLALKSRMDSIEKWQEKWLHYITAIDDDTARIRAGNEYNTTVRGPRDRQQTNLSLATIAQSPPQAQIQSPPQSNQITEPIVQMAPPKLRIFDGDILMWSEWWDSFTRLVDKKHWDDGYKLDQLVNHLSGRAHKYIQGYAGDPKNYAIVKERLQKKFGDNEVILDRLHKDLTHLPKAQNTSEIPKVVETIECICRQLEAKGENLEQRHIRQMIESKFPLWFVNDMYMQRGADWNVTKMRQYLEKWVDVREQAREAMDSNPPTYLHKNPKHERNPNNMNTGSVMQNKDKRMNHHIPQNQQPEPSHHIFKQPFTAACVTTDNDSKGKEIVLTADAQLDDEQEVLFLSKEIMVFNPAHPDNWVHDNIAEKIKRNNYVDNIHLLLNNTVEAIEYYHIIKEIFITASMNVRQFLSNDTNTYNAIPIHDRIVNNNPQIQLQLHVFTDASPYLLPISGKASLIFSKNRLKPNKGMTIPRMELMGLLIGHRISQYIVSEIDHPIAHIHLCSWFKVLRIIVIVLRFLCKLDKRSNDSQPIWRKIQCQFCSDKDVQRFQLWSDEHSILRCGGRLGNCQQCKRWLAKPFSLPPMPPLPAERV